MCELIVSIQKAYSPRRGGLFCLKTPYSLGGPPLEDSAWHVTDYYDNIRNKVQNFDPEFGACAKLKERNLPPRICRTVMKVSVLCANRFCVPVVESVVAHVLLTNSGTWPSYSPLQTRRVESFGNCARSSRRLQTCESREDGLRRSRCTQLVL